MPLSNLNNSHLDAAKKTEVINAITALEEALSSLTVSITPEERSRYGSINEQNKLLVNKVKDYRSAQPDLSDASLEWAEFDKDYESRTFEEDAINRLNACVQQLANSKILHDYDNWQMALQDYAYTSFMAGRGNPLYEAKYREMKQFFNRTGTGGDLPE